jgi:hypothetical protein
MRASAQIVVERPRQAVWDWASDPRHWQHWQGNVEVETVGDRITARHVYGGETGTGVYEVTESTPPRRQIVRSVSGPYRFAGVLELFEDVGGTRVRQTAIVNPPDLFTRLVFVLAAPLVRRSMRRQIARQLERLKAMVELEDVR